MKLELPLKTISPSTKSRITADFYMAGNCAQLIRLSKNRKPHPHTIFFFKCALRAHSRFSTLNCIVKLLVHLAVIRDNYFQWLGMTGA